MERRYNHEAFTPEDVEAGLMNDLISHLLDHNKKSDRAYYDIHITSDGYCSVVEWVSVPYEDEHYNGEFVYKDEDEVIMKEVILPDNTIEYCFPEEVDERLEEWYENDPNYYKDKDGNWVKNHRHEYLQDIQLTEEEFLAKNARTIKES